MSEPNQIKFFFKKVADKEDFYSICTKEYPQTGAISVKFDLPEDLIPVQVNVTVKIPADAKSAPIVLTSLRKQTVCIAIASLLPVDLPDVGDGDGEIAQIPNIVKVIQPDLSELLNKEIVIYFESEIAGVDGTIFAT